MLNISYQAAKNYLNGRLPNANLLLVIAEKRPYSIHWLLTGRGKKFADDRLNEGTPPVPGQSEQLVRDICVSVFNEMAGDLLRANPGVSLTPSEDQLAEEFVEKAAALSRRGY